MLHKILYSESKFLKQILLIVSMLVLILFFTVNVLLELKV